MPTPVTGNPTGIASPAVLPGPDTFVIVNEPIAGEGATAASVNQAFTALANEQAWEKKPAGAQPAAPGTLDATYIQPVKAWRTARGQRRDFADHRGFASLARITRWQEDWTDKAFATLTGTISADTPWAKRWLATQGVGGGTPTAKILSLVGGGPYPPGPGSPVYVDATLVMDSGNITAGPSGLQVVEAAGGIQFNDDTDVVFQTEMIAAPGGSPALGNAETSWGISPGISGATGFLASTSPGGVAIIWPAASAHRQLYACAPGGTPHALVDLGAISVSATRWRIEIQGANASDDGQRRILVYCDGDLTKPIANIVQDLTTPSSPICWSPFFRLLSGGDFFARFGVSDWAAVRWPGDIAVP